MANAIGEECVDCGACERVCPTDSISRSDAGYAIDPDRCSECVGFYHAPQCARVCPVDCCAVDPERVESEAVLFERARRLHAGAGPAPALGPETSRFRAHERTLGSALRRIGRRVHGAIRGA